VLHEFTSIPGVVEDTIDLILNLKQIPLKLNVGPPGDDLICGPRGAMEVKAGQIESKPQRRDPSIFFPRSQTIRSTTQRGKAGHPQKKTKFFRRWRPVFFKKKPGPGGGGGL